MDGGLMSNNHNKGKQNPAEIEQNPSTQQATPGSSSTTPSIPSSSTSRLPTHPTSASSSSSSPSSSITVSSPSITLNTYRESQSIDQELLCPICFETMKESFVTSCGHSFCYYCISRHLETKSECPCCGNTISKEHIYPNFILNKLLEKVTKRCSKSFNEELHNYLFGGSEVRWNLEDINTALVALCRKKRQLEENEEEIECKVLLRFLEKTREQKLQHMERLKAELGLLDKDIELIRQKRSECKKRHIKETSNCQQNPTPYLPPDAELVQQRKDNYLSKRRKMESHLLDLQDTYFSTRKTIDDQETLSQFATDLSKFTQFSGFKVITTLKYGDAQNSSSIVSSIEFDKDEEYFATAGVTKKIKIFDYANLISDSTDPEPTTHYPITEINCRSKISCLSWNSYLKNQICASDYEGIVSLWDPFSGKNIHSYEEHSKRVWSVDFSKIEPTRLASGSDDTTVKIWCTNQPRSVISIESQANICCVKFNPCCANLIAFGSSDHHVHCYDLKMPRAPYVILRGHKKAVSYVKFLNKEQLVSASTDSTLKLWDVEKAECHRTFTGHTNEKNFVGLAANKDFITCGSENNAVYTYYKALSQPVFSHKFGSTTFPGEENSEGPALFVSSVCLKSKNKTNVILAANSRGTIKVLELIKE